jgi:DNA-binding CsgD family transcriptional regulator
MRKGASGYLSKTLPGGELVTALEAIHAGNRVVSVPPGRARPAVGLDWPGRSEGLTERESEILALITQGKSNAEVAATKFLSLNSIKSYIRTTYRKIGVKSRTQAVLWGVEYGFKARPPSRRPLARRPVSSEAPCVTHAPTTRTALQHSRGEAAAGAAAVIEAAPSTRAALGRSAARRRPPRAGAGRLNGRFGDRQRPGMTGRAWEERLVGTLSRGGFEVAVVRTRCR